MITTIQISEDLKEILQNYKLNSRETYEDVIKRLIEDKKKSEENKIMLLREGYEEMYSLSKKIADEFENIDLEELNKNEF